MDFQTLSLKLARSENLPILPVAVLHLLRIVSGADVSSKELASAIGQDAGLAAKILRAASAATYGTGSCDNIPRAIGLIGVNRMKQMAVTMGYEQFSRDKSQVLAFNKKSYWEHCKVSATLAREIMAKINRSKQENAYMGGLIHDLGYLAMERYAAQELAKSIAISRTQRVGMLKANMRACGFTYLEVGNELARRWNLAPYIQDVIANHAQPENSTFDQELCMVVALAATIATEMGYPAITGIQITHLSDEYLEMLSFSRAQMDEIVELAKLEMFDTDFHLLVQKSA